MEPSCTFDEALVRYIGQFGPGQWRVITVTSLFQVSGVDATFHSVLLVE